MPEFAEARDTLVLVSPYVVPGKGGVRLLKDMLARGVKVKVRTDGIASTDELPVFCTGLEWVGLDDGKESRLTGEPHSSCWLRFKAWLYGIMPIERQL